MTGRSATGRPVVFLGPSLPRDRATALLDAVYLPPVDQGAVLAAVRDHAPSVIGIIDGAFGGVPAVRHKDILWAIDRGIAVFGAASMGALRAAELAAAGMVGVGLIYRWYRRMPLVDDDEVAVAMAPDDLGAAALSEALVNMRLTFRRAERTGVISADQRRALDRSARDTHFTERSYDRAIADVRAVSQGDRTTAALDDLEVWLPTGRIDQKADDASRLLRVMASLSHGGPKKTEDRVAEPMPLTEVWLWDVYRASRTFPGIVEFLPRNFFDAFTKNAG